VPRLTLQCMMDPTYPVIYLLSQGESSWRAKAPELVCINSPHAVCLQCTTKRRAQVGRIGGTFFVAA